MDTNIEYGNALYGYIYIYIYICASEQVKHTRSVRFACSSGKIASAPPSDTPHACRSSAFIQNSSLCTTHSTHVSRRVHSSRVESRPIASRWPRAKARRRARARRSPRAAGSRLASCAAGRTWRTAPAAARATTPLRPVRVTPLYSTALAQTKHYCILFNY